MNPTAYAVRKLYGGKKPGAWGDYKHRLHRAGVLPTPTADVPAEWQAAYRAARGW